MTSFALSSFTQSFSCSHESPASRLDSREEYCAECELLQEGSSVENAMNLQETNRYEQESEHAQSIDTPSDKGFGHQWTVREDETLDGVYDITNRLPSWLFLGKHIYPLMEQDALKAYLALPSTDVICDDCHLQINRFMGCLNCHVGYRNTKWNYWLV